MFPHLGSEVKRLQKMQYNEYISTDEDNIKDISDGIWRFVKKKKGRGAFPVVVATETLIPINL